MMKYDAYGRLTTRSIRTASHDPRRVRIRSSADRARRGADRITSSRVTVRSS